MRNDNQVNADILNRAQGCWLGQLCGDALGSMVEFNTASAIAQLYPHGLHEIGPSPVHGTMAGQITDDSEMALALARTLLQAGCNEEAIAAAYGAWLASDPFDVGGTIKQALGAIGGRSGAASARAAASRSSQANGAMMRQSPLAIWGYNMEPAKLAACVRADTTLTHPNPACQDASAAYVLAMAAAIREGLDVRATYEYARDWQRQHGQSTQVTECLAAAEDQVPSDYISHQGWALIALQNAFYQLLHAPTLEQGVVDTVIRGGDSDTNAAIAGALLGAVYGVDAIPQQWRDAVLNCQPASGSRVLHPRPEVYWANDALELTGQLLTAQSR